MSIACPKCSAETAVIDSRNVVKSYTDPNGMVRRRRKCVACGHRFTTFELSEQIIRKFLEMDRQRQVIRGYISGHEPQTKRYQGRVSEVLQRLQKE